MQKDETNGAAQFVDFLTELMRLKSLPRTGWLLRGVRDVESLAAHSYGVAFIAMMLADRAVSLGMAVNVERVLRMALLHDAVEVRTGDLPATIKKYFGKETLHTADQQIAKELFDPLSKIGQDYFELWNDYESRVSIESRIVKAADKLDLLLQAHEYEKGGAQGLDEFWENSDADFSSLGIERLTNDLVHQLRSKRAK